MVLPPEIACFFQISVSLAIVAEPTKGSECSTKQRIHSCSRTYVLEIDELEFERVWRSIHLVCVLAVNLFGNFKARGCALVWRKWLFNSDCQKGAHAPELYCEIGPESDRLANNVTPVCHI